MNNNYMQVVKQCKACQKYINPINTCKNCDRCNHCCLCEGGFREKISVETTWTTISQFDFTCGRCGKSTAGWCECRPPYPKFTNTEWISNSEPTDSEPTDLVKPEMTLQELFRQTLVQLSAKLEFPLDQEIIDQTPKRLHRMYHELLAGYSQNPAQILSKSFSKGHKGIIAIRDIDFVSLCEHHWMPFKGVVHFGYLPKSGNVIGLSKIPRLIQCFSKRFQTQENMTQEIVNSFMQHVDPQGCIAISEAEHLCYQIRGPKSKGVTVVSEVRGEFEKNNDLKDEFLRMIGK